MQKRAVTDHPIEPIFADRWSPRAFRPGPIQDEKLDPLFEAARWAPSSANIQPWRFIYAHAGTDAHERMVGVLNETNAVWARNAGVLAMAIARKNRPDGRPNGHARYDLGQSVAFLVLQASILGLVSHQMGGFDPQAAQEAFAIPPDHEPVTMIAIGYQADPTDLPEGLRERELMPRERQPVERFAFQDRWVTHIMD
jgi:nitroreductase